MPLSVGIDIAGTDNNIPELATRLAITEGRQASSWYDNPGVLELTLEVCNNEINEDNKRLFIGRSLEISSQDVVFYRGIIAAISFKEPEQGGCSYAIVQAFSVDEQLARGSQIHPYNSLTVTAVEITIPIEGGPEGITVTDENIYIANNRLSKVLVWSSENFDRMPELEFNLGGGSVTPSPVGITSDEQDTFYVADINTHPDTIKKYEQRRRYAYNEASSFTALVKAYSISSVFSVLVLWAGSGASGGTDNLILLFESRTFGVLPRRTGITGKSGHSQLGSVPYGGAFEGRTIDIRNVEIYAWDADNQRLEVYTVRRVAAPPGQNAYLSVTSAVAPNDRYPSVVLGKRVDYVLRAGTFYYFLSIADKKVYCYMFDISNGTWNSASERDILLVTANASPKFIVWNEALLFVYDTSDNLFYAYSTETFEGSPNENFAPGFSETIVDAAYHEGSIYALVEPNEVRLLEYSFVPGQYVPDADISTNASYLLSGCVYLPEEDILYVCYSDSPTLEAYDATTRERLFSRDINAGPETNFAGLAADTLHVMVLDHHGRLRAFRKLDGVHNPNYDLAFGVSDEGSVPSYSGLAFRGNKLFALRRAPAQIEVRSVVQATQVVRPRETGSARYGFLYNYVLGGQSSYQEGSRLLPSRNAGGLVRDAFRRVADSDPGRAVEGVLYPHSRWRLHSANTGASGLTRITAPLLVNGDSLVRSPVSESVSSLVINQITVIAFDGTEIIREGSASVQGFKNRTVATDVSRQEAQALAEWNLDKYGEEFTALKVNLNAFYEPDDIALAIAEARPHTAVYVDVEGYEEAPWLVLNRRLVIMPKGAALDVSVELTLVTPRLFGIGWVLDSNDNIIEDKLDVNAYLIEPSY